MIEGDGEFDHGFGGSELSEFCDTIRDRLQLVKSPKVHDRVEMMLMNYERSGADARTVSSMLNEIKDDFMKIDKDRKDEAGGGHYDDWTRKEVRELYYALYGEVLSMRYGKDLYKELYLEGNRPAEAVEAPEPVVIETKKELSEAEKKKVLNLMSREMFFEFGKDLSGVPDEKLLEVLQKIISNLDQENMRNDENFRYEQIEEVGKVLEFMHSMNSEAQGELLKEVLTAFKKRFK